MYLKAEGLDKTIRKYKKEVRGRVSDLWIWVLIIIISRYEKRCKNFMFNKRFAGNSW